MTLVPDAPEVGENRSVVRVQDPDDALNSPGNTSLDLSARPSGNSDRSNALIGQNRKRRPQRHKIRHGEILMRHEYSN